MRARYTLAVLLLLAVPAFAQVQRFTLPGPASFATSMTSGPDGRRWVSGYSRDYRVEPSMTITPLPHPVGTFQPIGEQIAVLPDGSVWRILSGIQRIDPETGAVLQMVAVPARQLFAGSDGNLWALTSTAAVKISPAGVVLATYTPGGTLRDAVFAGDGAFWIVTDTALLRMTTSGAVTTYAVPFPAQVIAAGGGVIWIASTNAAARLTLGGEVTGAWQIPAAIHGADDLIPIAVDSVGNLWLATTADRLTRITSGGILTDYAAPAPANPCAEAVRWDLDFTDGALWFVESFAWPPGSIGTGPCTGPPTQEDAIARVNTTGLTVLREVPLPAHGAAHIPALDVLGIAALASILAMLGVFRVFGR